MMSLSDDKQADVIGAFNTTSICLDDILNINVKDGWASGKCKTQQTITYHKQLGN